MDITLLNELTRDERSALTLALEFTARFLGRDTTSFTTASTVSPRAFQTPSETALSSPKMQKFRASVARQLYADDLRKDLVDRAVYAVASKIATRHDINRLIANAVRTVESNNRRGIKPDRAWLLFWSSLKTLYNEAGLDFPTMRETLEPVPDAIIKEREERERLAERVQATLRKD